MLKRYLLAPGPTPVPPEVLLAMARPMFHHRAPEFDKVFAEVRDGLKWLYQTKNNVLMLAASGTGGMEGAVSNFLSPGDKALTINGGKFGERWTKLCKTFGAEVTEVAPHRVAIARVIRRYDWVVDCRGMGAARDLPTLVLAAVVGILLEPNAVGR